MSISLRAIPLCLCVVVAAPACASKSADAPSTVATPTQPTDAAGTEVAPADAAEPSEAWLAILGADHRSAENRARDEYRHPAQTLAFFGVEPTHTVVELAPGQGWYTEILAPYLREGGKLIVTSKDPAGPASYYGTTQAIAWRDRVANEATTFGAVETVVEANTYTLDAEGKVEKIELGKFALAPAGSVDVVLTFRSSHGWYRRDALELAYGGAFEALKPGGVFGVVQHRAAEGADPAVSAEKGYLPEAVVIAAAKSVGFELAASSEINANPKDTKDYEGGVWVLPPSLSLKDVDRDKYVAIGESDRMTLRFVKPAQ